MSGAYLGVRMLRFDGPALRGKLLEIVLDQDERLAGCVIGLQLGGLLNRHAHILEKGSENAGDTGA
jgi:hypothetical protein